jgi:predicted transcriptional regulator
VPTIQLPCLIRDVYQALALVGHVWTEPIKAQPSADATNSVFADHIVCLDCGGSFRMLKGHLPSSHQMTPHEYRAKWGLPSSYRLVAPEHTARRSKIALAMGLGRKVDVVAKGGPGHPNKKRGR